MRLGSRFQRHAMHVALLLAYLARGHKRTNAMATICRLRWVMLILLGLGVASPGLGQDAGEDETPAADQILVNLRYSIAQLRDAEVVMGALTESHLEGFHEGSFVVNGQQIYRFLVATETEQLYLIALGPIDVSLSADDVALLLEQEEEAATQTAQERHDALNRFAAGMPARGRADATVTIFEFSDFQCPYCSRGFATIEELLLKRPDDVRFVYLHYPLPNHDWAMTAAVAAVCAANQHADAFWGLHDNFFRNQSAVGSDNVLDKSREYLADSGIDLDVWSACAGDKASAAHHLALTSVEASMSMANRFGVTGTPGFFVNGQFLNGVQTLETFEEMIESIKSPQ